MKYVTPIIAAAALLLPLSTVIAAGAAEPLLVAGDSAAAPVTLTSAKQTVAHYLSDNGQHELRVGRAEFDRDGNVAVEIVSLQGIPVRHVVVDAKSGTVAAARTGAALTKKS